ncbi:hypothetical protein [Geomicrobium sediminis]|uniref:Uncharacterized protein n=1 Tax=Geomicrobium sediminis TaxID=1347788 RepID=A0ABS2PIN0_9BACL|nr:hypothetical protein [Geomicrobium sediminis]MBM7634951.1 hypothetical protein [Geomicrobium sediminis]
MTLTFSFEIDEQNNRYIAVYNSGELVSKLSMTLIGPNGMYRSLNHFISQQRALFLEQAEGIPHKIFIEEPVQHELDHEQE